MTKYIERCLKLPPCEEIVSREKKMRAEIYKNTLEHITNPANLKSLNKTAQNNMDKWRIAASEKRPGIKLKQWLSVREGDWGDVTKMCSEETGEIYAVLNLANQSTPGSGVIGGSAAQEENMWRRSTCALSVKDEDYKGYSEDMQQLVGGQQGMVYFDKSPRVCFKTREDYAGSKENPPFRGYKMMPDDDIFPFYELRSAAIDASSKARAFDEGNCRKRIQAQLETLMKNGIKHVVLGAFGCGAFRNPEEIVARIYKEELEKRRNVFDHVVFAIYPRPGQTLVKTFTDTLKPLFDMPRTPERKIASCEAMVIGDALGSQHEFLSVLEPKAAMNTLWSRKKTSALEMKPHQRWEDISEPGQWTDDASMGLCMLEVLTREKAKGRDIVADFPHTELMLSWIEWWYFNLNTGRAKPVGLGGVIALGLHKMKYLLEVAIPDSKKIFKAEDIVNFRLLIRKNILEVKKIIVPEMIERVCKGNDKTDGNGSLMRNIVASIADTEDEAVILALKQSKTTTAGPEAALCSMLHAYLSYHAIHGMGKEQLLQNETFEAFLALVQRLRQDDRVKAPISIPEETHFAKIKGICSSRAIDKSPQLNWRCPGEEYQLNPDTETVHDDKMEKKVRNGYYGAYAIDGLALALNILHNTNSLQDALTLATIYQGDSDSIAAIVGILAGAIYGNDQTPKSWKIAVNNFSLNPGRNNLQDISTAKPTQFILEKLEQIKPTQSISEKLEQIKPNPYKNIIQYLDAYIRRVENRKNKGGEIDYSAGFWFFICPESRGRSREANYRLAVFLKEKLNKYNADLNMDELFSEKFLIDTRADLYNEKNPLKPLPKNPVQRGINSHELINIIKEARKVALSLKLLNADTKHRRSGY